MRVLTLNSGSRSHSLRLYDVALEAPLEPPEPLWHAEVEASDDGFAELLEGYDGDAPDVAAHRVVHPGQDLATTHAALVDDRVRAAIEAAVPLARSHDPLALEGMDAIAARFGPTVRNVAVFDTLLGADAPREATTYAVPDGWAERFGIRRYGFHGISQRDVLDRIDTLLGSNAARRLVSVHLGSGCSISAFHGHRAVDTTMGMTPLEGLVMGARSGSLDPGVIFTLLRESGLNAGDLERELSKSSGLRALSGGRSSDTRDLVAASDRGDERARFALAFYAYRIRWHIGAMTAAAGGLDVLSFTGPVGEHSAEIREAVCDGLEFLGVELDHSANAFCAPDVEIARPQSRARVCVIRTLEEWAMARIAARYLEASGP